MIQVLDGKSEILNTTSQKQGDEDMKSTISRSDFPELEFVKPEEIAVANDIRKEIQFFKAAALQYLDVQGYLLIDNVEHIVNDVAYGGKNPLITQVEGNEIAFRIIDLLKTKEVYIQEKDNLQHIKLSDLVKKFEKFKSDFPEVVSELVKLDIETNLNINIVEFMYEQEKIKDKLMSVMEKSLNLGKLRGIIVGLSTWLSKLLKIKGLDLEEQIAQDIIKLLSEKLDIDIQIQRALMAQRCMKIVENI